MISLKNWFNTGFYSDSYRSISFKFSEMIEITKLYILRSVWLSIVFIQVRSCMINQTHRCSFSRKFRYRFA